MSVVPCGMIKVFKIIENALIDVRSVVKTKMNQIVGFEEINKMEKIQAKYMGVLRSPIS
jgi:hypothetical protein